MGLNLETLIGILVILILLIVADGVRRMVREHRGRLRVKLDPRVSSGDASDQDEYDSNPELPGGGARVVRPTEGEMRPAAEPDGDETPPLVMEAEEHESAPAETPTETSEAGQQALFPDPDETAPGRPAQTADSGEILEVIVVHVLAPREQPFEGRVLLQQLLEQGLRFGEMNIFHRHEEREGRNELQFSMANALEPGIFDLDEMESQRFSALSFFLRLPGPRRPRDALERMLASARKIAQALGGELRDEQHSVLTPQTVDHLYQRVQEFERRQRLAHGH